MVFPIISYKEDIDAVDRIGQEMLQRQSNF